MHHPFHHWDSLKTSATATGALPILFCAGGLLLTAPVLSSEDGPLRAGMSRVEITPTLPVMLAG